MILISIISILFSTFISADYYSHEPSPEVLKQIAEHNKQQALLESFTASAQRANENVVPFVEYGETGYVFFSDDDYQGGIAREMKNTIAQNLPESATLVVYTTSSSNSQINAIEQRYGQWLNPERLIVVRIPPSGSNPFWSRDNLPLPVFTDNQLTLVDARYYYNFEPDLFLQSLFSSLLTSHNYFYEGGNFMANSRGECLVVNRRRSYPGGVSDTAAIPDSVFQNNYGCKKLTRFKHLKGIGHIDEVVKFISDDVVVTDTPEYIPTLESLGYTVHQLPEAELNYETYINSLIVNDVVFVPVFNEKADAAVLKTYQNLLPNHKIVPVASRGLATRGQGGVHCITMNYPPHDLSTLLQSLGARQ